MPISVTWDDTEPPTLDIDLRVTVDREDARRLRSYLREINLKGEAQVITDYLNSIANWRHQRKVQANAE